MEGDSQIKNYSHLEALYEQISNEVKSDDLQSCRTERNRLLNIINKIKKRIEEEDEYDEVFKVKFFDKPNISNKQIMLIYNSKKQLEKQVEEENKKKNLRRGFRQGK